jgi:DNA-binding FrmR family transcriptional regulator
VQLPDHVAADVRRRLHRVVGQVQGLERMLDDGRDCREIVVQLSAATKALEQAGFRMVAAGLSYCLEQPDEAEADGYALDEVQRLFMKLA